MNRTNRPTKLAIGVSSCLLGIPVRFDGSHRRDTYITEVLGKVLTLVPVCPEVETGMGVPRETIDLHSGPKSLRLIGNESGVDRTASMNRWSSQRVRRPDIKQVCGFILKSKSPTCGLKSARIISSTGRSTNVGRGLFASALIRRYETIPVVEESDLHDPGMRENFIVRLFAYHRMQIAVGRRPTLKKLASFHRKETWLLDAHSRDRRHFMDQLLLQLSSAKPSALRDEYVRQFMAALALRSTVAKNLKVLNEANRVLTKHASSAEMEICSRLIGAYHRGECQLSEVVSELRRCAENYGVEELCEQSWLFPDEREVQLRFNM